MSTEDCRAAVIKNSRQLAVFRSGRCVRAPRDYETNARSGAVAAAMGRSTTLVRHCPSQCNGRQHECTRTQETLTPPFASAPRNNANGCRAARVKLIRIAELSSHPRSEKRPG